MKDPTTKLILWYILAVVLIVGCSMLTGCQVLKTKRTATKDSVAVIKTDTGRVIKNEVANERKEDWWREVAEFGRGDTVTINNYTTTQPVRIIREGGTIQQASTAVNYDSLWGRRFDSLAVKLSTTEKSKETKVLSMWQIIGLAAGASLVMIVLSKLKISIR